MAKETRKPRRNTAIGVDFEYRYILVKIVSVEPKANNRFKVGFRLSENSFYYGKDKEYDIDSKKVWFEDYPFAPSVGQEIREPMIVDID